MGDANPAAEAGLGAEALLGLAAGHASVRLPRISALSPPLPTPDPLYPPAPSLPSQAPSQLLPSHLHADLPRPPSTLFPPRQDLPGIASISSWPSQQHSQYAFPPPAAPFDPIRQPDLLPPRSAPPASQPHLSSAPWQSNHPLSAPEASSAPHDYLIATSQHSQQWGHGHPHVSYAYPHAAHPSSSYYYYHGAAAPPSTSHLQPPHPSVHVPPPSYSIPPQHPHQSQSVLPAPLALPIPLHRASDEPSPALGAKVPSVHDIPAISQALPTLEAKYMETKPVEDEKKASSNDIGKVCNVTDEAFPQLSIGSEGRQAPLINEPCPTPTVTPTEEKPKRKGGLADLMNPTDKMPGSADETEAPAIAIKGLAVEAPKVDDEIAIVDSVPEKSKDPPVKAETLVVEPVVPKVVESAPRVEGEEKKAEEQPKSPKGAVDGPQSEEEEEEPVEMEDSVNNSEERDDENADSEETRCPCRSTDNSGFMIACDECNTWQHGKCMGFRRSSEVPDKYYCNLCRPDEMRLNCIAHPRYKERNGGKERDRKETRRDTDALLAAVKPMELRKHFVADLKHKRTGARLSKSETFNRYAGLLRHQFNKHRQSIVDGLAVLLEMQREDVADKLDSALKRIRSNSVERGSDEHSERRRERSETQTWPGAERERPHSARSNPQKRSRPSFLGLESSDGSSGRLDPQNSDLMVDIDVQGDAPNSRMTREERKLQQTMKLFARMEEREREKKKPRTGEVGTSPKSGPLARPKTPRSSAHPRSVSPKAACSLGAPAKNESSKGVELTPVVKEPVKMDLEMPPRIATESKPAVETQQGKTKLQQPQVSPLKGSAEPAKPVPEAPKDHPKREKENKTKERPERISLRRRDASSPDGVSNTMSNRRKGILDRERSQDGKRRRAAASSKDGSGRGVPEKEEAKVDASLDFKMRQLGPSVLGCRVVTSSRVSALEKERMSAEEDEYKRAHNANGPDSHKKQWLLDEISEDARKNGTKAWRMQSPARKRYRPIEQRLNEMSLVAKQDVDMKAVEALEVRGPTLSVSMVVVSEKGHLPDKGQKLEASRLVLSGTDSAVGLTEGRGIRNDKACLKKRPRMYPKKEKGLPVAPKENRTPLKSEAPPPTVPTSSTPKSPSLSKPCSSPDRIRSPMLRSSPVPSLSIGLRSASPPPMGKIPSFPLRSVASPILRKPSPRVASASPSPRGPQAENPRKNAVREEKMSGSADSNGPGMNTKPSFVARTPTTPRGIPMSRPKPAEASAAEAAKPIPRTPSFMERNQSQSSGLSIGLRSIRSVPVSQSPRVEVSKEVAGTGREEKLGDDGAPQLGSSKLSDSAETTITDIFQRRLEGFLKPSTASPQVTPNGVSSSPKHSQSSKSVAPAVKVPSAAVPLRVPNGVTHSPMSSYRGKPGEPNGSWRGGSSHGPPRRPLGGLNIPKSVPANGPVVHSGRISPSSGDRGHFRSRNDPPGLMDDHHSRGRMGGPPWGSHGHKNGWLSGSGRGSYLSKESNAKSNRRGRY